MMGRQEDTEARRWSFLVNSHTVVRVCFLIILFYSIPVHSEFESQTHFIDTPTAYMAEFPFTFGINSSFTTKEDPWSGDINGYINATILKRVQLGLSFFTSTLLSFELAYRINDETRHIPTFGAGSKYLTLHKWICPVSFGKDIGWEDDETYPQRNSEQFSFFIVATKDMGAFGVYNLGIGRGSFVGYGPRSRLFNIDYFLKKLHNDAVGVFWGGEILIGPRVFALFDFDGRDFNVGIKIKHDFFQIGFSASKLEHRIKGSPLLYPRFATGIAVNSELIRKFIKPSPRGVLCVVVTDASTGAARLATVSFPGTVTPSALTDRKTGSCTIHLNQGAYWVRVGIPGYFWAERKVYVGSGMSTTCHFKVRPIIGGD